MSRPVCKTAKAKMASQIPSAARLLVASALLVAMLEACTAASSSLSSFWQQKLPRAAMPAAFEQLAPPLSARHTRHYLAALQADASLTYTNNDVCSAAAIFHCPSKATVSGPQPRACVSPFIYNYAAEPCSDRSPSAVASASTMFFSRDSLSVGKAVQLPDTANDLHGRRFLPYSLANALPELSEQNMAALAKLYGIRGGSDMELAINISLAHCGYKSEHELMACHTSGESMISFIASAVGHDAVVYAPTAAAAMQEAAVVDMSAVSSKGGKVASCHDMQFPSLMYSCHMTQTSELMEVTLKLADGKTARMPAICHMDTSYWNPSHMAFQVLKVEPGKGSVCHWFPENSFIFAQPVNQPSSSAASLTNI